MYSFRACPSIFRKCLADPLFFYEQRWYRTLLLKSTPWVARHCTHSRQGFCRVGFEIDLVDGLEPSLMRIPTVAPDDLLSRTFMRSHVPVTHPGGLNSPKSGTLERICCERGGQDMKPCHHSFLLPQGNYSLTSQKGDFDDRGHPRRPPAS